MKGRDFQYSLPKTLIDSISQAKDSHRVDLPIFITRLIQSLHKDFVLLGELEKVEEKGMLTLVE